VPDLPASHHLSPVPVERFGLLPMTALVGLGLLAAAAGVARLLTPGPDRG